MGLLRRLIDQKTKQEAIAEIASLESFVQTVYWGESLKDAEAKARIEDNLLEIVYRSGQHCGNGLLITKAGYFLTARHVIDEGKTFCRYLGKTYPVKRSVTHKNADVGLGKIALSAEHEPIHYKVAESTCFGVLLSLRGDALAIKGFQSLNKVIDVIIEEKLFRNSLAVAMPDAGAGDSGGVIASTDGAIIGMHSLSYDGTDIRCIVRMREQLALVSVYAQQLRRRYL